MKLISADKLRKQMSEDYAQSVSNIRNPTVKAIVEKAVETFDGYVVSAETVEAIPVDWIEAKMKKLKDMDNGYPCLAADILYGIVADWRREQNDGEND